MKSVKDVKAVKKTALWLENPSELGFTSLTGFTGFMLSV